MILRDLLSGCFVLGQSAHRSGELAEQVGAVFVGLQIIERGVREASLCLDLRTIAREVRSSLYAGI